MRFSAWLGAMGLLLAPLAGVSAAPSATPACSQSSAIMAAWASTVPVSASRSVHASSEVRIGQAMAVKLHPKGQVHFAATTDEYRNGRGYAGTLRLKVDEAGTYRFDVDARARVDVASNGRMAYPSDHGAVTNCSTIHEYVEFRLARGDFLLQLSSEHARSLKVLAMRVD